MTNDIHQVLPEVQALMRHDHSAEVIYNGGAYVVQGEAPHDTRERAVHYITYLAAQVARGPVSVRLTDPDGTGWRFVIHPDGQVTDEEVAPAQEPAAEAAQEPAAGSSSWEPPPGFAAQQDLDSAALLEQTVIRRPGDQPPPAQEPPAASFGPDPTPGQEYPAGAITYAFRQDPGAHAAWAPEAASPQAAQDGQPQRGTEYGHQPPPAQQRAIDSDAPPQPQHTPEPGPAVPPAQAPHVAPQAATAYPGHPGHPQAEGQPPAPQAEGQPPAPEAPLRRRDMRASFLAQEQTEAPASTGVRGALSRMGIRTQPGAGERAERADVNAVSQHWPGVRTIAIVNGKGGANKTPTTALLSAVFARHSGAATLAWDNNETRGTLGWRTDQGHHAATVFDLIPEVDELLAPGAKAGDISHFVHHQPADKYDVLRSNPNLLSAEQRITGAHVDHVHDVAGRYYRLIFVDSGNDESAGHWLRIIDKADQIVVATIAKPEHAEAGALLLEALAERGGHAAELARKAVVIVSQAREKDANPAAAEIAKGFADWVREVVTVPYDPAMVESVLRFDSLRPVTKRAWLRAGAAVAAGL